LALDITSTRNSIFTDGPHVDLFLPGGSRAICVAFASWGADGFMVRILATIWSLLLPVNLYRFGDSSVFTEIYQDIEELGSLAFS